MPVPAVAGTSRTVPVLHTFLQLASIRSRRLRLAEVSAGERCAPANIRVLVVQCFDQGGGGNIGRSGIDPLQSLGGALPGRPVTVLESLNEGGDGRRRRTPCTLVPEPIPRACSRASWQVRQTTKRPDSAAAFALGRTFGSPRKRQAIAYSVWSMPSLRKRSIPDRTSRPVCSWRTGAGRTGTTMPICLAGDAGRTSGPVCRSLPEVGTNRRGWRPDTCFDSCGGAIRARRPRPLVFAEGPDVYFDSCTERYLELGKVLLGKVFVQPVRHRGRPPAVKSFPVPVALQRWMKVVQQWHGEFHCHSLPFVAIRCLGLPKGAEGWQRKATQCKK
jgi:hypothetical protein